MIATMQHDSLYLDKSVTDGRYYFSGSAPQLQWKIMARRNTHQLQEKRTASHRNGILGGCTVVPSIYKLKKTRGI